MNQHVLEMVNVIMSDKDQDAWERNVKWSTNGQQKGSSTL